MFSTRAISCAALRARNPAISTMGSISGDAGGGGVSPSPYQNPLPEPPQAPHLQHPPSPSVEPLLALLLVLPQVQPGRLLQVLPKGLLQALP
ncbi:hypothetical protein Tco_1457582 [Tanacetum coccineum]